MGSRDPPRAIVIKEPDRQLYRRWRQFNFDFAHSREALRALLDTHEENDPGGRNF